MLFIRFEWSFYGLTFCVCVFLMVKGMNELGGFNCMNKEKERRKERMRERKERKREGNKGKKETENEKDETHKERHAEG